MKKIWIASAALTLLGFAAQASAVPITNFSSRADYLAAAGPQTVLDFSDQSGILPADLFATSGVTLDGNDFGSHHMTVGDPDFDMTFSAYHTAVGFDFPTVLTIDLYDGTTLLGSSDIFYRATGDYFGGVITEFEFNRIVVRDPVRDRGLIYGMYFGAATEAVSGPGTATVPEPGSVSLLALGLLAVAAGRRRARSH